MVEKLDGIKHKRDHVYGRLKFEVTEEQHDFLKSGIPFVPE
jgi:hypothetical protein